MNIRDVVVQEQKHTAGREATRSAADILHSSMKASEDARISKKAAVRRRDMEVPVIPVDQTGKGSGTYSATEGAEMLAEGMETAKMAGQSLTVLTGEDYQNLEEKEGALEKYEESSLERAVERIRAEREWKAERQEENAELRKEQQEGLEQIQAGGFLSEKSEAQIREALQQADLPVTQEIINQVVAALQMSQTSSDLSDSTKAFLIERQMLPTIENIYHAQHSGMGGIAADQVSEEDWQEYLPQIQKILSEYGAVEETDLQAAKWLFANELPIDGNTLQQWKQFNQLEEQIKPEYVLQRILAQLSAGGKAVEANLDDTETTAAKDLLEQIEGIQEEDIAQAVMLREAEETAAGQEEAGGQNGGNANQQNADRRSAMLSLQDIFAAREIRGTKAHSYDIQVVTAQRQIAEIRLSMTLQSVITLRAKGFAIEVEPLEQVVQQLRALENQYYTEQMQAEGADVSEQQLDLMRDALSKTADIAAAPAVILANSVRQHQLLTVNELHGMAVSAVRQYQQYNQDFEAVGTQVRADLGDSIQKAFAGISSLLQDLGLEDTEANQRAVRILGYNRMEITVENVQQMKEWDAQVNQLIQRMKPSTVLELIREGDNPVDLAVEELNQKLADKQKENGIPEDEKYSRYLWKLEKNKEITDEERKGYIGVYRLLHQIEKSDGAAVGAVLQAGREVTLGNLLTAVRTMRGHGIDSKVSDEFGATDNTMPENSITRQIAEGFRGGSTEQQAEDSADSQKPNEETVSYYQAKAEELTETLDPAKLHEMSDGELQKILGNSLEKVAEEMKQFSAHSLERREYFEEQAADLRETVARADTAREYLERLDIPGTLENLRAAEYLLEENGSVVKELFQRRGKLPEEEQQEFVDTLEGLAESIDSPEELREQCKKAESFMEKILAESREDADITSEDLRHLKVLGQGLRLNHVLNQKRSYEIPIQADDTMMTLNLTIIENAEDAGRIQVSMEEAFGRVSAELRVQDHQVKGLVLCDDRNGFDVLKEQVSVLEKDLVATGYRVKDISCGMDYKSRAEWMRTAEPQETAETKELYRAAKLVVTWMSKAVKQIEA